jgi:hypothetical protein
LTYMPHAFHWGAGGAGRAALFSVFCCLLVTRTKTTFPSAAQTIQEQYHNNACLGLLWSREPLLLHASCTSLTLYDAQTREESVAWWWCWAQRKTPTASTLPLCAVLTARRHQENGVTCWRFHGSPQPPLGGTVRIGQESVCALPGESKRPFCQEIADTGWCGTAYKSESFLDLFIFLPSKDPRGKMLKFLALAVIVAVAVAAPPSCGCEEVIAKLEQRIKVLEAKLGSFAHNSESLCTCLSSAFPLLCSALLCFGSPARVPVHACVRSCCLFVITAPLLHRTCTVDLKSLTLARSD